MAQVRTAVGAADLDPLHAESAVLDVLDGVGDRLVERRPAAAGVELGVRLEELGAAGLAGVDALGLGVGVLAGERSLGAGLAQYGVLLRREFLTPLLLALVHLVAHASTVVGQATERGGDRLTGR